MKKQILAACLGAMMMVGTAHAFTTEVITNVGGSDPTSQGNTASSRFYFNTGMQDVSLVTGYAGRFATQDTPATNYAILGIRSNWPVLGQTEVNGEFTFANGANNTLRWVNVTKNWMYKLTDKISLGVSIPLVRFGTNGAKEVQVLGNITPQIGMNIDLM